MDGSAQTYENISFICMVWITLLPRLSSSLLNIICRQIWYQHKSDYMDRALGIVITNSIKNKNTKIYKQFNNNTFSCRANAFFQEFPILITIFWTNQNQNNLIEFPINLSQCMTWWTDNFGMASSWLKRKNSSKSFCFSFSVPTSFVKWHKLD